MSVWDAFLHYISRVKSSQSHSVILRRFCWKPWPKTLPNQRSGEGLSSWSTIGITQNVIMAAQPNGYVVIKGVFIWNRMTNNDKRLIEICIQGFSDDLLLINFQPDTKVHEHHSLIGTLFPEQGKATGCRLKPGVETWLWLSGGFPEASIILVCLVMP